MARRIVNIHFLFICVVATSQDLEVIGLVVFSRITGVGPSA